MKPVRSRFGLSHLLASVSLCSLAQSLELGGALNCAATAPRKLQRFVRPSPQRTALRQGVTRATRRRRARNWKKRIEGYPSTRPTRRTARAVTLA